MRWQKRVPLKEAILTEIEKVCQGLGKYSAEYLIAVSRVKRGGGAPQNNGEVMYLAKSDRGFGEYLNEMAKNGLVAKMKGFVQCLAKKVQCHGEKTSLGSGDFDESRVYTAKFKIWQIW